MEIKVDEINRKAIIELNPEEWFITKGVDEFPFALAYRIDMSYKGKTDQWTQPIILLDEEEANKLRGLIDEVI